MSEFQSAVLRSCAKIPYGQTVTYGELARRIVDFTSGVTYALDGHMLRVGEEIFLFTPSHISITADLGSGNDHTLFPLE